MMASLTRLQGLYYIVSGTWPLVHFTSFELLTGPKHDRWLVRTVGLLAAAIGVTLVRRPRESRGLAAVSAASFAIADVDATLAGQPPVYLADAVLEAALFVAHRAGR